MTKKKAPKKKKLYYIQDRRTYVGNSVLWWRVDGCGYTTDLDQAWQVDAEDAASIVRNRPDIDKAWPVELIDKLVKKHVDMQTLPENYKASL